MHNHMAVIQRGQYWQPGSPVVGTALQTASETPYGIPIAGLEFKTTVNRPLTLDVLVPTHNRGPMLERAVRSVLAARQPESLAVRVVAICNGCTDDSLPRMRQVMAEAPGRVEFLWERRRGKSTALNVGISRSTADLIGLIDDDEEVGPSWLTVIADAFTDPTLEFIGGPYVPVWRDHQPDWLPPDYLAVIGSADAGPERRPFGPEFPGILKGGNGVVRRATLARLGGYAEELGPGPSQRLFSCEDEDMYLRLLETGARGEYRPDLIIYHHVSAERLTRNYFRQWCYWRGVSRGIMSPWHPELVPHLMGVPRFVLGAATRGALNIARDIVRRRARTERFRDELRIWDALGFLYGRHVYGRRAPHPSKRRRPIPAALADAPVDTVQDSVRS
jgi:glucosyl-dolichyl phosphate glucuronosyltransferase